MPKDENPAATQQQLFESSQKTSIPSKLIKPIAIKTPTYVTGETKQPMLSPALVPGSHAFKSISPRDKKSREELFSSELCSRLTQISPRSPPGSFKDYCDDDDDDYNDQDNVGSLLSSKLFIRVFKNTANNF